MRKKPSRGGKALLPMELAPLRSIEELGGKVRLERNRILSVIGNLVFFAAFEGINLK